MPLPSLKKLTSMHWTDAAAILEAHARDEREALDSKTLWRRRGRAYARKLCREKLKRIERFKMELGLS